MNGESYRYIAPAPSTRASSVHASSPSHSNSGFDGSSSSGPRRKLAVACDACRYRKQKCDGTRPTCTPCKSRKTECSYETQPDETRYSAIKRKTENLEKESQAYKELLTSLRVRPEEEAQDLLQRIRNTRTFNIGTVLDASRKGGQGQGRQDQDAGTTSHQSTQPPASAVPGVPTDTLDELDDFEATSPQTLRNRASGAAVGAGFNAATLHSMDSWGLLNRTSPLPPFVHSWTTVTDNSNLVADLLALFFQQHHSSVHFFDMYLFIEDMNNNRTNFCTPLLVNAVLAIGCTTAEGCNDNGNLLSTSSLAASFYLEARRHWQAQEGHDSITRIQGGVLLAYFCNMAGRDKIGLSFQDEAVRIAKALGLFSVDPPAHAMIPPNGVTADNWNHHRTVTAWMLFNWQALAASLLSTRPTLDLHPPVPIPYADVEPFNSFAAFRALCHFSIVQNEIAKSMFSANGIGLGQHTAPAPETVWVHHEALLNWYARLPNSLLLENNTNSETLTLYLCWNSTIIRLFKPFSSAGHAGQHRGTFSAKADQIVAARIMDVAAIVDLFSNAWGFRAGNTLVLHSLLVTAYVALDLLRTENNQNAIGKNECYSALLGCFTALEQMRTSTVFVEVPLRALLDATSQARVEIPQNLLPLVTRIQSPEWLSTVASNVQSQYLSDYSAHCNPDDGRTDVLIASWMAGTTL